MRTTVDLGEALIADLKELAARRRTTLSGIVQEAVAVYLSGREGETEAKPFVLITAGLPGGAFPSPRQVFELLDEEERPGR